MIIISNGCRIRSFRFLIALADMCHCCAYILKTNFLMAGPQCFMDCTVFIVVRKWEHIILFITLYGLFIWTKGEVGAVNRFNPSSKIFLLTDPRRYFFCILCFSCFRVCSLLPCGHLSRHWKRAVLLALFGDVYCIFVTFPCVILGHVCYLIV